jgi:uncharacterized Zn finger protein
MTGMNLKDVLCPRCGSASPAHDVIRTRRLRNPAGQTVTLRCRACFHVFAKLRLDNHPNNVRNNDEGGAK